MPYPYRRLTDKKLAEKMQEDFRLKDIDFDVMGEIVVRWAAQQDVKLRPDVPKKEKP